MTQAHIKHNTKPSQSSFYVYIMNQQDIKSTLAKIVDIHQAVQASSMSTMQLCHVLTNKAPGSKEVLFSVLQLEDEMIAPANDLITASNLAQQAQRLVSMDLYELTSLTTDPKKSMKKVKSEAAALNPQVEVPYDHRPAKKARKSLSIKLPAQPLNLNDSTPDLLAAIVPPDL